MKKQSKPKKSIKSASRKVSDWLFYFSLSDYCVKKDRTLLEKAAKRLVTALQ